MTGRPLGWVDTPNSPWWGWVRPAGRRPGGLCGGSGTASERLPGTTRGQHAGAGHPSRWSKLGGKFGAGVLRPWQSVPSAVRWRTLSANRDGWTGSAAPCFFGQGVAQSLHWISRRRSDITGFHSFASAPGRVVEVNRQLTRACTVNRVRQGSFLKWIANRVRRRNPPIAT